MIIILFHLIISNKINPHVQKSQQSPRCKLVNICRCSELVLIPKLIVKTSSMASCTFFKHHIQFQTITGHDKNSRICLGSILYCFKTLSFTIQSFYCYMCDLMGNVQCLPIMKHSHKVFLSTYQYSMIVRSLC